jgi:hemoglobin
MTEENTEKLPSIYEDIGGEKILNELVNIFYDIMDKNPEFEIIRKMHPENLDTSKEKLFMFLSGWMGGPALYINKYGHPRLRARHLPFIITEIERDQWLKCMYEAMNSIKLSHELKVELMRSFYQIADFMRNK